MSVEPAKREHLFLWGFMGTGKSRIGHLCAAEAVVSFDDLDEIIAAEAGEPIAAIFAHEGEAGFRARERRAVLAALESSGPRIVALGGGALLDPALRERALATTFVVTLTATVETLLSRTAGSDRPLLQVADRPAVLARLLGERDAAYRSAHAIVPTDGRTTMAVCDRVLSLWRGAY